MADFADKVVLITGASSGIGQAMTKLFAERSSQVFETVRKPGSSSLPTTTVLELDMRDDHSVQRCIDAILEKVGRIMYSSTMLALLWLVRSKKTAFSKRKLFSRRISLVLSG